MVQGGVLRNSVWPLVGLVLISGPARGQSYDPPFDPSQHKGPPVGTSNEVMVLGTPHLATLRDFGGRRAVEPLLARLTSWRPTNIAVETMPGRECEEMRRRPERFADAIAAYCYDPRPATQALGLSRAEAEAEAARALAGGSDDPPPAVRRRLAALLLASGDPTSALVQWLRLPENERRSGDGLTADLAASLEELGKASNETVLVAAELASRLGLERVIAIDHQAVEMTVGDETAYGAAITAAWDNPSNRTRQAADVALQAALERPEGLLGLYRALNAPDQALLNYQSDWGAALQEPSREAFGRRYVAYWETRNLRMAANARETLGQSPGARLLIIVGASHKAYLEAYLDQMHDVVLVGTDVVLDGDPINSAPDR